MSPSPPESRVSLGQLGLFGVLLGLLVCAMMVGLAVGTVTIPFGDTWRWLWSGASPDAVSPGQHTILYQLRLPRVLLGLASGCGLALCGCVMQGVFRNPLADPYLLGIAGGATTGAGLCIALGWSAIPLVTSLGAFGGGLVAVGLVYVIAQSQRGRFSNTTLILVGIAVGAMFGAITSFLTYFSGRDQLQQIIFWGMGDLGAVVWSRMLPLVVVLALSCLCLVWLAQDLNALALGDEMAQHLGINPQQRKQWLLGLTTLLTAAIVAVTGTIGFVGLIIPHMMRTLCGPDHRILLPASGLAGGVFLVLCDALARTAMRPLELPVGLITALCGAPFFLYLLRQQTKR